MNGNPRLAVIPHLAIAPPTMRYDLGDEIARQHGEPMAPTACGEQMVSTLTTRRRDLVRCPSCRDRALTVSMPAGTAVEIQDNGTGGSGPAFQSAVVVDQPRGNYPPNKDDVFIWVRYTNDCVVPVREYYVRVLNPS